jgi:hypothetical protein
VHAINLFAADTAEGDVLARLQQRVSRIQMSEIELASCVINRSAPAPRAAVAATHTITIDLRRTAVDEAARIHRTRRVDSREAADSGVVPVTVLGRRRRRRHVDSPVYAIAFMRTRLTTHGGRLIEDTLVPVTLRIADLQWRLKRREIRAKAEALLAATHSNLIRCASTHAQVREKIIANDLTEWSLHRIAREHHIADDAAADAATFVQAGLFESRAVKRHREHRRRVDAIREQIDGRTNVLEAEARVFLPHDPELALFLITDVGAASAGSRAES